MKNEKSWTDQMIASTPKEIYEAVKDQKVTFVGFGAGPSFVGQYRHTFETSVSFLEGLTHLERYAEALRICRLVLENGDTVYYERHGFLKVANKSGEAVFDSKAQEEN